MSDHILLIFMNQFAVSMDAYPHIKNQPLCTLILEILPIYHFEVLWAYPTISDCAHLIFLSQYVAPMDFYSHTEIPLHKLTHS